MTEFYPSKGYTWKSGPDAKITNTDAATVEKSSSTTTKGVLRAQETQAFRHWMDKAIETSSYKVMKARQVMETSENEEVKPSGSAIDIVSSQTRGNI